MLSFIPAGLLLLATPTKYNIVSVTANGADSEVGAAYTLLIPLMLCYTILGLVNLVRFYRKTNDGLRKTQVRYIFLGMVAALVPGIILNGILPVFGNYSAVLYGPNVVIILAIFMSIAIVKHRLLEIRLIVARTLTYVLLLATVATGYAALILGLGTAILPTSSISTAERIFYVAMALVIATTYQPLKKFFDKLTNKYFFQDIYDTKDVLDQISSVIVGNVDPTKVQKGALSAISKSIRPRHAAFVLYNSSRQLRTAQVIGEHPDESSLQDFEPVLRRLGKKITDYDDPESSNDRIRKELSDNDVVVVAPLVTKEETIGYLVLGPKKTGGVYSSQDIGLLSIATNELAVALQNAQRFEEIQAFNLTLQEKVNEATRELKATNKKLVALDEAKDEFISMASHQLRTPLTSIKGYLSMILDGDMGKMNKNQTAALKEAFGSSQRMVFLISDFLNVSRIRTGKFVIEPHELDMPRMVHEELRQLNELSESRDITLKYEPPGEFPTVKLDDNKIRQVMMNMVDNAIYYTPDGGTVTIQLYVDGKDIVFKVIDTGIGVPKLERHKLFSKFFRAGNAKVARPDGTGLGLFMAQKIIVAQGGSIIFESEEGKGSTFGFRFPLKVIKL